MFANFQFLMTITDSKAIVDVTTMARFFDGIQRWNCWLDEQPSMMVREENWVQEKVKVATITLPIKFTTYNSSGDYRVYSAYGNSYQLTLSIDSIQKDESIAVYPYLYAPVAKTFITTGKASAQVDLTFPIYKYLSGDKSTMDLETAMGYSAMNVINRGIDTITMKLPIDIKGKSLFAGQVKYYLTLLIIGGLRRIKTQGIDLRTSWE